jgi:adenylate cyclase
MKRYTLRVAITTLVSGLILVSAVTIVTILYYGVKRALYQTTYEMMAQITHSVSDKLTQRLVRVERLNGLISKLIRGGTLDPAREAAFTSFLRDTAAANSNISVIDCGLPSGHKFQALRMADGTVSLRVVHRTAQAVVTTWRHENPAYAAEFPDSVESLATGYDPRARPWYQAAVQAGKRVWTNLYSSKAGLNYSNANPVYDPHGKLLCVISIDMRLEDLSQFMQRLKVGNAGKPFILDPEYHVIAMPLDEGRGLDLLVKRVITHGWIDYSLFPPEEIKDPTIRHAVLRYRNTPNLDQRGYLAFHDPSGQRILASFTPIAKYKFTLGVVVPEAAILGPIKRDLNISLILSGGFFLVSLGLAYRISRAIAKPLATLAVEVDRIRQLDLSDVPPVPTRISEVARIGESVQNMRKGLLSFSKYVPADVVNRLLHLRKEAEIEGERRELTLFFSDIADFTSISEQLSPEQLVARLGDYFQEVTGILIEASGTVDKFIGDAVMGFWGAPNPLPDHARRACGAALAAQAAIAALNRRWEAEGDRPFHTRMGIHTGEAIVGNVGFEGRMNYTAMGDTVNLASRLEGLNKYYGTRILISETTLTAAGDALLTRHVDRVTVKGRERAIAICELLAMRAEAPEELILRAEQSDRAFEHYLNQRWDEALRLLESLPGEPDGPSRLLAERCRLYRADPPGAGWDGVFRYHEK